MNLVEHNKTRVARGAQYVFKIAEHVESSYNSFDLDAVPDELVNITTGRVASQEVSHGPGNSL